MKKISFICFIFAFIVVCTFYSTAFGANRPILDKSNLQNGIIKLSYKEDGTKTIKVGIIKGGNQYIYSLKNDGTQETFPLQMGNGAYKIYVYQNITGNSYVPIFYDNVTINLSDDKSLYENSIQNINWDLNMKSIQKAQDMARLLKNDDDKVSSIYNFIVNNFSYDMEKWKNINNYPNPYIPAIDTTYNDKKGICYDYSSLFAAMLRSLKIPTKLDMGYCKNVSEYHAWNEVYLPDANKWVIVDTTYDSQMNQYKKKFTMIKDTSIYAISKTY